MSPVASKDDGAHVHTCTHTIENKIHLFLKSETTLSMMVPAYIQSTLKLEKQEAPEFKANLGCMRSALKMNPCASRNRHLKLSIKGLERRLRS